MNAEAPKQLLTIRDTCSITSLSRTSIWAKVKAGTFPKPLVLGDDGNSRKAFLAAEVDSWIKSRIAERDAA